MAVSKRLRHEIMKRDNYTCRYCRSVDNPLTIDHVVPVALGGTDDPSNLVAACKDCNAGKSSVPADAPLIAQVADDAVRMAKALEIVAEQRAAERKEAQAIYRKFKKEWKSWYRTDWRGDKQYVDLPGDWQRSIDQFLDAGLTIDDLIELVQVAMGRKNVGEWVYFCGCCWTRVRQNQERAMALIEPASTQPRRSHQFESDWSLEDLEVAWSDAMSIAADCDDPPVIGCIHLELGQNGHCGDPICMMQAATELDQLASGILTYEWKLKLRSERISDAAEELEDADA